MRSSEEYLKSDIPASHGSWFFRVDKVLDQQ